MRNYNKFMTEFNNKRSALNEAMGDLYSLDHSNPIRRSRWVSALALMGATALLGQAAMAQDGTEEAGLETQIEEVVVVGLKSSLITAQEIKRDADTVVDSITAQDIGAFPDKSVAEALQRVSGVTVSQFAAPGDTSHFSAEPSGVIVRGLPQVRSEFNGRDVFNANSSRGLSFADVPPELMAAVDTYKNQTAEMIEGGISGTINLRTRLPFDVDGRTIALSAGVEHGSLAEETTPNVSGIYIDNWDTDVGRLGLMLNAAYSNVVTQSEGVQIGRWYDMEFPDTYNGFEQAWVPRGVDARRNEYDRTRLGNAFAAQWESPDAKWLGTIQFNRSEYSNDWREYALLAGAGPDDGQRDQGYVATAPFVIPPEGESFQFDSRGVFQQGTLNTSSSNWAGNSANFQRTIDGESVGWFCHSWEEGCPATRAAGLSAETRYSDSENTMEDTSFNLQWNPSDKLALIFDVQYVDAEVFNFDNSASTYTFADVDVDLRGEKPSFAFTEPTGIAVVDGGFSNPANWAHGFVMEHFEESEGDEVATRLDMDYYVGSGWVESLHAGVRHADREQNVNYSTYNWGAISMLWAAPVPGQSAFIDGEPWNGETYEVHDLGPNLLGGGIYGGGDFVTPALDIISNYDKTVETFDQGYNWTPIGDRDGLVPGTIYRPVEMLNVEEVTDAAYFMMKFGGPSTQLFGLDMSGNVGVRYVRTEVTTAGGIQYPEYETPAEPAPGNPPSSRSLWSEDDIAFQNDATVAAVSSNSYDNVLPSLNVRLSLTEDMYLRFAASRAMSRPDMGHYKNRVGISVNEEVTYEDRPNPDPEGDPLRWPVDVELEYSASAGNPNLEATTADQLDLTYEWYFSDSGSFTTAIFYKDFDNYLQSGTYITNFTNNGVTRPVTITSPLNGEGASIEGFEIAYQSFFDFLPEPFDGFGIQTNYTYINNSGISNSNLTNVSGDGSTDQVPGFTDLPLTGLSDHAYNIIGMYEKGPFAARLAYNWRDGYLVTTQDCCIKNPVWSDDFGKLDASIRYQLNDSFEVSLQASNILDSESEIYQQVNQEKLLLSKAWFRQDRRFSLGLRYKY